MSPCHLITLNMLHIGLLVGITCGSTGVILLLILIVCVYLVCHRVWSKKQKLLKTTHVNDVSMYRAG